MDEKRIITATLADIYLQQGHLEKALEIYERLVRREPDNEFYKKRCNALKKELKEKYNTYSLKKILMKKIW
ncbi:MAG: tetratricopeptide repeat protein [Syntrophorhabdales bacterium]|jgi:pentatricopeptide repeat protein|nr:tetratricopeptide repeat protein [Syntrophorhabdales bacterium]